MQENARSGDISAIPQAGDGSEIRRVITLLGEADRVARRCASPKRDMLVYLIAVTMEEARLIAGGDAAP